MLTKENKVLVSKIICTKSQKYSIQVMEFANVGNHLHLVVKTLTKSHILAKKQFSNFLREVTGFIAFKNLKRVPQKENFGIH